MDVLFDCIVVGSGAGGLSAAIFSAKEGLSVLLLDASSQIGGYLNPFMRKGYHFDTGVHLLGGIKKGGSLRYTLEELGVWDKVSFTPFSKECISSIYFAEPNLRLNLPSDLSLLCQRLNDLFPEDKKGIETHFRVLENAQEVSNAYHPRYQFTKSILTLHKLPGFLKLFDITLGQHLDGITTNQLLRTILSYNWLTYGLPPSKASAFYAIMVFIDLADPYYPKGGSNGLKDALVERAKGLGVQIKNLSEVVYITKEKDKFVVKVSDGKEYRSKVVICNADPYHLYGRILDRGLIPSILLDKVKKTRYSISMFCAYIGTRNDPSKWGLDKGILVFFKHPDLEKMWVQTEESPEGVMFDHICIVSPTARDRDIWHLNKDRHTIEIMAPAFYKPFSRWAGTKCMKRGKEYDEFKSYLGQKLLEQVERFYPGLTLDAEHVEFSTPLTNESWVKAPFGACYGPDQAPDQIYEKRFPITSPVSGLFLCGAGTKGGGVSPCMLSGLVASKKAISYLKK